MSSSVQQIRVLLHVEGDTHRTSFASALANRNTTTFLLLTALFVPIMLGKFSLLACIESSLVFSMLKLLFLRFLLVTRHNTFSILLLFFFYTQSALLILFLLENIKDFQNQLRSDNTIVVLCIRCSSSGANSIAKRVYTEVKQLSSNNQSHHKTYRNNAYASRGRVRMAGRCTAHDSVLVLERRVVVSWPLIRSTQF